MIMSKKYLLTLAGLLAICLAPVARGSIISITNSDFQNMTTSVTAPNLFGVTVLGSESTNIDLWTITAGDTVAGLTPSSVAIGTAASLHGPTPPEGSFEACITLGAGVGAFASLSQTLDATYQANATYNLSLELAISANVSLLSQSTLELQAGSTTVASLTGSSLVSLINTTNNFQTIDLSFTTGNTAPSGDIGIEFTASSVVGLSGNLYLDDAQLTMTPTPEPRPGALFAAGFGVLLSLNHLRKK
jgi:hypothetical protein